MLRAMGYGLWVRRVDPRRQEAEVRSQEGFANFYSSVRDVMYSEIDE